MTDGHDEGPDPRGRLSRRRLLALSGAALLAGCGGDEGAPTDTATATDRDTPSPTDTAAATPTPTPTATATATARPTPSPTATPAGSFDPAVLDRSAASAFPPTAGFGDGDWLGAGGLQVLSVRNLQASGEGSLRWALEHQGPRLVVFEAGGVVDLEGDEINVGDGQLYVAGQTAPSPGITVIRGYIEIDGDDTIVQHIRVRSGDRMTGGPLEGPPGGPAGDPLTVGDGASNVILDHCSVSWGSDENMSIGGGAETNHVTLSNNLIAEGLSNSPLHPEMNHAKGTLVNEGAQDTAVIGNVYTDHNDRHPRINGGAGCAVVNNFVYNYQEAIEIGGDEEAVASIVGNYFKGGPATPGSAVLVKSEGAGARAYVAFNKSDPPIPKNNRMTDLLREKPLWPEGLNAMLPGKVPDHDLRAAGARPADRTPHDRRIVEEARNDEGGLIDSQDEVGGYPELEAVSRALDVPETGSELAEWLYRHTRAVELPDAEPP